jgi:hypothetical protein
VGVHDVDDGLNDILFNFKPSKMADVQTSEVDEKTCSRQCVTMEFCMLVGFERMKNFK